MGVSRSSPISPTPTTLMAITITSSYPTVTTSSKTTATYTTTNAPQATAVLSTIKSTLVPPMIASIIKTYSTMFPSTTTVSEPVTPSAKTIKSVDSTSTIPLNVYTTVYSTISNTHNFDKSQADGSPVYFSKFHDGGSYTIQRPRYPISTSYRKPSGVQIHVPVDDLNTIPNYKKNYEYMSGEDLNQSEDPSLITDTSEKLIELGENNSGVLAYLVSNPHIPGEDFLVTKAALINSGVIYNKVVKLTSYSGRGGGKVEILNDKVFSITGAWYRGSGSA